VRPDQPHSTSSGKVVGIDLARRLAMRVGG
jgi:hypothetical protein